jgi:xanthine/uracil permease
MLFSVALLQVGDVSATAELSLLSVDGPDAVRRIRGGMFNDAMSCLFSSLAGSMPMTTFAQVHCLLGSVTSLSLAVLCAI